MKISQAKYMQAREKARAIAGRVRFFRRSSAILFSVLFLFVACYALAVGMLNPRFLLADAREKIGAVKGVTTVSVRVIDVPEQPVVTATPGCTGLVPRVNLSWNDTLDTDTYDIARDSLPLVSGLVTESYQDNAVALGTTYTYEVTAIGPRGSTTSVPVNATTAVSCLIPTCTITSVGGIDMTQETGTPRLSRRKPAIAGTTNIPNADIQITLTNNPNIIVTVSANVNGYWSWTPSSELNKGVHTLTVTATDPNDPQTTVTTQRTFKIVSDEEEEEEKKGKASTPFAQPLAPIQPAIPPETTARSSLTLKTEILNPEGVAYAGEELVSQTTIEPTDPANFPAGQTATLQYQVLDEQNNVLAESQQAVVINGSVAIEKNLTLPKLLKNGRYTLRVQMSFEGELFIAEATFTVKEKPLVTVGQTEITWSWIVQVLSWFILWLLLLLILFLILLSLEHHKSTKAVFHITEEMLARRGQIPRRRGVAG